LLKIPDAPVGGHGLTGLSRALPAAAAPLTSIGHDAPASLPLGLLGSWEKSSVVSA